MVHEDRVRPRARAVVGDKIAGVVVPPEEVVTLLVDDQLLHQLFPLHDVQVRSCGIVITGFIGGIIYVKVNLSLLGLLLKLFM